jgi:hypothetical protein
MEVFYLATEMRVNAAQDLRQSLRRKLTGKIGLDAPHLRPKVHQKLQAAGMTDLLDLIMLILASLGALAFGILAAYAILRAGFALMRPPRRRALMKTQPQTARIS